MGVIARMQDGWHFFADSPARSLDFGPYDEKSGAESCRTQYEAFVAFAPTCHHK